MVQKRPDLDSPMMRRVLAQSRFNPRVNIPRKGRIRAVLLIVALGTLVLWLRSCIATAPREGHRKKAPTPTTGVVAKKANAFAPLGAVFSQRNWDFDQVSAFVKRNPPHLDRVRDTVKENGGQTVVHYSLDTALYKQAKGLLKRYHPKYGAVALLDPVSGRVLSLVSYVNDGEPSLGGELYGSSHFPAASVFKTITAAGAIERGRLQSFSELRQFGRNHTLYASQLTESLASYRMVTLMDAFAHSVNPIFGRLGIYVLGKNGLQTYAERFGFDQDVPFELALARSTVQIPDSSFGLAEVASGFTQTTRITPLFGALIAAAVSERGRMPRPRLVDSVTVVGESEPRYRAQSQPWRTVMQPRSADELKLLMMGVTRYGTARKSFRVIKQTDRFKALEYGGKTGSLDKDGVGRVDWFVGFARDPYNPARRIAAAVVTVHGPNWTVHSSYIAAELFRSYFKEL